MTQTKTPDGALTRRQCLASAAALPLFTILPQRAQAAEFTYKLAIRPGPTATALCCPMAMARCCCTRCST